MLDDITDLESVFITVSDDIGGMMKTQAIRLAAQMRLPDLVSAGPKSVRELAEATGMHEASLHRLLYALASCGYFEEVESGVFAQTPRSYVLRTDVPHSLHAYALVCAEEWQWLPWLHALRSFQTGKAVLPDILGKPLWDYFNEDNPEAGKRFMEFMDALSSQFNPSIARSYDFSSAGTVIDVGGGLGSFLATVLETYPALHGILFDRASVIEQAQSRKRISDLKDRLTLVRGSFHEAVPAGADTYVLKQILHDWEDEVCIHILSNCRKVMNTGGRVLVIDEVTTPDAGPVPPMVALLSLQLQLNFNGHQRSEAEYRSLFEAAGFQFVKTCPTPTTYSVLEAIVP